MACIYKVYIFFLNYTMPNLLKLESYEVCTINLHVSDKSYFSNHEETDLGKHKQHKTKPKECNQKLK